MNIFHLQKMKEERKKITMVTCYDYWSAKIISTTGIDCVLVGDSLAMAVHGHSTTIPATADLIELHLAAVMRGISDKLVIADMPFLTYRKDFVTAMQTVEKFMRAGAHAIKLEGADGNENLIQHIVKSGIPVMGHIGLTPQSVHQLGGFRVQGKDEVAAENLRVQALALQDAGCFSIVLECVPAALAKSITEQLSIPTIGIGAGPDVDGQVLVFQDLLGLNNNFKPKFLKTYLNGFETLQQALNQYDQEVKTNAFPNISHCY